MSPLSLSQIHDRLEQHRARRIDPSQVRSWASVALVLRPSKTSEGRVEILFIRRSRRDGDPWSGHMAFPGGREEPGDQDPSETAMRETLEEVGLDLWQSGCFLGALDDQVSPLREGRRELVIRPHVFSCGPTVTLSINNEVERSYWFDLEVLAEPARRGSMPYSWKGAALQLPVIHIEEADIWGLSLRMLDDFYRVIGWDSEC